jgi:RNA polymerase sigma factor (sigma-70 family)
VIQIEFAIERSSRLNVATVRESELSDSLLQRVAAGDTAAVARCVDQYGGLIWSLARRYLRRPAECEDGVQEVFIELWKSAHRFDPDVASETAFVSMIARRRMIDRARRASRRGESESVALEDLSVAAPEETDYVELQDEAASAKAALAQLKPQQRQVLQLAVCQGWSHQVIAERLGIPLGTVKTHVRRGLIKIREELAAERAKSGEEATP